MTTVIGKTRCRYSKTQTIVLVNVSCMKLDAPALTERTRILLSALDSSHTFRYQTYIWSLQESQGL